MVIASIMNRDRSARSASHMATMVSGPGSSDAPGGWMQALLWCRTQPARGWISIRGRSLRFAHGLRKAAMIGFTGIA